MIAYVNGRFVDDREASVSVFDRGFLYGDSVFETLRVSNGRPFRWPLHVERLRKGAAFLGISVPTPPKELRSIMASLTDRNQLAEGLLRITLSRGPGARGYSPREAGPPTLVVTAHELPPASGDWRLRTASLKVAVGDKLGGHKVGSRLLNVLARAEAESAGADEALILNTSGEVLEAASGNVFWVQRNLVLTPPSAIGALPGVTRAIVLELCAALGITTQKRKVPVEALQTADGMFVTNSARGIVNVASLDGVPFAGSPVIARLQTEYARLLARETMPPAESAAVENRPFDDPTDTD